MKGVMFSTMDLRDICIRHDWFTGGSCEAYEKLFQRCEEGADLNELALLIWVCTPDVDRKEIYYKLLIAKAEIKLEELSVAVECVDYKNLMPEETDLLVATRKILEVFINA